MGYPTAARDMTAGELAAKVMGGVAPKSDRETDVVGLIGDLATFERRVSKVSADLADLADRMWGERPSQTVDCTEAAAPGCQFERVRLIVSNLASTIERLESEAARFERLA